MLVGTELDGGEELGGNILRHHVNAHHLSSQIAGTILFRGNSIVEYILVEGRVDLCIDDLPCAIVRCIHIEEPVCVCCIVDLGSLHRQIIGECSVGIFDHFYGVSQTQQGSVRTLVDSLVRMTHGQQDFCGRCIPEHQADPAVGIAADGIHRFRIVDGRFTHITDRCGCNRLNLGCTGCGSDGTDIIAGTDLHGLEVVSTGEVNLYFALIATRGGVPRHVRIQTVDIGCTDAVMKLDIGHILQFVTLVIGDDTGNPHEVGLRTVVVEPVTAVGFCQLQTVRSIVRVAYIQLVQQSLNLCCVIGADGFLLSIAGCGCQGSVHFRYQILIRLIHRLIQEDLHLNAQGQIHGLLLCRCQGCVSTVNNDVIQFVLTTGDKVALTYPTIIGLG